MPSKGQAREGSLRDIDPLFPYPPCRRARQTSLIAGEFPSYPQDKTRRPTLGQLATQGD